MPALILTSLLGVAAVAIFMVMRMQRRIRLLDETLNSMGHGVCTFDQRGKLLVTNTLFSTMYGFGAKVRRGTTIEAILTLRQQLGSLRGNPAEYFADCGSTPANGVPDGLASIAPTAF